MARNFFYPNVFVTSSDVTVFYLYSHILSTREYYVIRECLKYRNTDTLHFQCLLILNRSTREFPVVYRRQKYRTMLYQSLIYIKKNLHMQYMWASRLCNLFMQNIVSSRLSRLKNLLGSRYDKSKIYRLENLLKIYELLKYTHSFSSKRDVCVFKTL